ncbi:MAG: AAA family ATPase [Bacilli bacterium]
MSDIEIDVVLDRKIFASDNGYQIVKCSEIDTKNKYVLVGHFIPISESKIYHVKGNLITHEKYGEQIDVVDIEQHIVSDGEKLVDYFSGGLFFGIGKITAKKIVNLLGDDAITKIIDDESVLYNIDNFSKRKAKMLHTKLKELNDVDNNFNLLLKVGFSQKVASKIYCDYGVKVSAILKDDLFIIYYKNPYKYKLKTFFDICVNQGVAENDIRFLAAKLYEYIDNQTFNSGNTYINKDEIENLGISDDVLNYLIDLKVLVNNGNRVMLLEMYRCEENIAKFIKDNGNRNVNDQLHFDFDAKIKSFCDAKGIVFSKEQCDAVRNSFLHKVSIITGGPGSGKTTIVSAICKMYINEYNLDLGENIFDSELVLLAPTGRAAKRLNEQTDINASTIHRYLKWNMDNNSFDYSATNKCSAKVVIIDEVSMIDTYLLSSLISAFSNDIIVILIGDDMQLSSVGCGDILYNLIESNMVFTSKLVKVYRQEDDNLISFMHSVRNYEIPIDLTTNYPTRNFVVSCEEDLLMSIQGVIKKIYEKGLDVFDFQFLIPMYRGKLGIDNINRICQKIFNEACESKKEYRLGEKIFRVGDKVLITKNFPNDNVYNGDLGRIVNISFTNNKACLKIDISGKIVEFGNDNVYSIAHGYAISIHKAQGSEFKKVIMPISVSYSNMLKHNLVYTGITRTSESLLLIGQESVFVNCVCNNVVETRKTNLLNLLEINEIDEISPFNFI